MGHSLLHNIEFSELNISFIIVYKYYEFLIIFGLLWICKKKLEFIGWISYQNPLLGSKSDICKMLPLFVKNPKKIRIYIIDSAKFSIWKKMILFHMSDQFIQYKMKKKYFSVIISLPL